MGKGVRLEDAIEATKLVGSVSLWLGSPKLHYPT